MSFSSGVNPGTSEFVESVMNTSTPSSPRRAKARRSVRRPSSGNWSILKSPVPRTSPAGVRIATASASGIEWLTATNSRSNGPTLSRWPLSTFLVSGRILCSTSFASMSASVSVEPYSVMSLRSLSKYGTAPMWSSCPCVRTMPTMSSSRSRIGVKSGRIRSTPGCVSSGNKTPQSTMSNRPSNSNTVMLRPISPSPPSGMILKVPASSGRGSLINRGMCPLLAGFTPRSYGATRPFALNVSAVIGMRSSQNFSIFSATISISR